MFSKENSSEEISFSQPPQTEVRAMNHKFRKLNENLGEKIKKSF